MWFFQYKCQKIIKCYWRLKMWSNKNSIQNTNSKLKTMRVHHLFENQIYMISNHAVARNPLFKDKYMCIRFLKKIDLYLGPICKILHYCLDQNQFQILVKLNDRDSFCRYYLGKKMNIDEENIPHSSHIFSQAMANLQSSAAIHFNRKNSRTGALFARRFSKHLIKSKEELEFWVERLQNFQRQICYTANWVAQELAKNRGNWVRKNKSCKNRSAAFFYKYRKSRHMILSSFARYNEFELQGQFTTLFIDRFGTKFSKNKPHFNPSASP